MIKKMGFLAIVLLSVSVSAFGADQIVLVTGEWEPYVSEKIEGYGFTTEIVTAVFQKMGLQPVYTFYPWKRCELEVVTGRAFATFPYHINEERKKEFDFSDAIGSSTWRFFYLKTALHKNVTWEKLSDLKGYRIGCSLGNWYDNDFKEAGLVKVEDYATSDELSFRKLWFGRADLVPADELVGWAIIQRLFPHHADDFGVLKKPLKDDELHLMISRQYPGAAELKERFNTALMQLRQNGTLKSIRNSYLFGMEGEGKMMKKAE